MAFSQKRIISHSQISFVWLQHQQLDTAFLKYFKPLPLSSMEINLKYYVQVI